MIDEMKLFEIKTRLQKDLSECGKYVPAPNYPLFTCGTTWFSTIRGSVGAPDGEERSVIYKWLKDGQIMTIQVNERDPETLLEGVTDFYIIYYPEAASVLYMIELDSKWQLRGYCFMNYLYSIELANLIKD